MICGNDGSQEGLMSMSDVYFIIATLELNVVVAQNTEKFRQGCTRQDVTSTNYHQSVACCAVAVRLIATSAKSQRARGGQKVKSIQNDSTKKS